jgi:TRAP-type C4-dicarboxylate transport system permease small subunit
VTRLFVWPVRALAGLVRAGVVAAMLLVLASTVGQVADRHLIKSDFGAYDQYGRLGLVWLTFLGIAVAVRERANIRIDLLDHFLPARVARVKGVVLDVAMAGVAVLLVVVGWPLLEVGSFQIIMDTPFDYEEVYAALLLGMAVLALFVAVRLLDGAARGRLGLDIPPVAGSEHDPI